VSAEPALEMIDVHKRYDGGVQALRGVNLVVHRRELCAIVGPSGSGKSTLLHIMGTLERASAGIVRIAGIDVAGASERRLAAVRAWQVGFVFQQFQSARGAQRPGERRQRPSLHGHARPPTPSGGTRGARGGRAGSPRRAHLGAALRR